MIGEKPLDVAAKVTLNIEFPDDLPGLSTRRMNIQARVARCARDLESAHDYKIGFAFESVTTEQTMLLQALILRYQFTG